MRTHIQHNASVNIDLCSMCYRHSACVHSCPLRSPTGSSGAPVFCGGKLVLLHQEGKAHAPSPAIPTLTLNLNLTLTPILLQL